MTAPPSAPTEQAPERGRFWAQTRPNEPTLAIVIGGLVVVAWVALLVWGASPYDRYLDHASLDDLRLALPVAVGIFVAGWTLMIVAMMLPTAYPVVSLFAATVRHRQDRGLLVALCVAGYLGVWAGFGYVAYVADIGVHSAVEHIGWLEQRPWLVGGGVLAVAGAYQFSDLKYRCLDACRSPRLFVLRHWTGRRQRWESAALGFDSGLYCLGCCWTLMLVIFAAGAGSIPLMFGLGTAMAVEKNISWGTRISTPLGLGLLAVAAVVVVDGIIG